MNRNDRLELENILCSFVRPHIEVRVVSEWHADQIADRVLQFLGNLRRIVIGRMTWGGRRSLGNVHVNRRRRHRRGLGQRGCQGRGSCERQQSRQRCATRCHSTPQGYVTDIPHMTVQSGHLTGKRTRHPTVLAMTASPRDDVASFADGGADRLPQVRVLMAVPCRHLS